MYFGRQPTRGQFLTEHFVTNAGLNPSGYTLTYNPGIAQAIEVTVPGAMLIPNVDYAISSGILSFIVPQPDGITCLVRYLGVSGTPSTVSDGSVTPAKLAYTTLDYYVSGAADITLTGVQAANSFYHLTGTLTGNINLIVPVTQREFTVLNDVVFNGFTLTVKTAAGTGVLVNGDSQKLICDGVNVVDPINEKVSKYLSETVSGVKTFTESPLVPAGTQSGHIMMLGQRVAKNLVIGGDFSTNPWARGASFTNAAAVYTADRFRTDSSCDATFDVLKTADAPSVIQAGVFSQHCLHLDVTAADVIIGAAQQAVILHRIEGINIKGSGFGQSGTRYLRVGFWHKHTKTGINCVAFRNGGNNRTYVAEYTQVVSDQWEYAPFIIPVDVFGTWYYDTQVGLDLIFVVAAGSNHHTAAYSWTTGAYLSTANQVNNLDNVVNSFKLQLISCIPGQAESAWEDLLAPEVKRLTVPYFERRGGGSFEYFGVGQCTTTSVARIMLSYQKKRIAPTSINLPAVAAHYSVQAANGGSLAMASYSTNQINTETAELNVTGVSASLVVGNATLLLASGFTDAVIDINAEL